MVTFPKAKEAGLAESVRTGAKPVPLREMLVSELGALLTSERVAAAVPATVGVNSTVSALDWPGAMVSGKFSPLRAKAAPFSVACETVRLALPGLLKVMV